MSIREIDELFTQALSGAYEDDAPWEAVHALRAIGTWQVFERAAELCKSTDPLSRARGADVLAQLGKTSEHRADRFLEESYSVITDLVRRETEIQPLSAAIAALGQLDNPLAVPLITNFSSHSSPEVRFDVAFALGCFPNDRRSAETLLQLTQDKDKDVRDWATFALGVLGDADSAEIREALVRLLNDSDENVREEAMVGLGKRKDQRVVTTLLASLGQPATTVRVIQTAYLMLGMEGEQKGWTKDDYAAALRQCFSR
ncbi:MAG TPA: HEAT repeat domain-containing protein [Candidatus Angelobacter sp.]|nr:HEAT repeat domain-containing protein [Candidatus Angelobacter sp.]